jgi:hypothetical protein
MKDGAKPRTPHGLARMMDMAFLSRGCFQRKFARAKRCGGWQNASVRSGASRSVVPDAISEMCGCYRRSASLASAAWVFAE